MTAQQLRNAILQEAIQGRLVPQDPNDEPASVLLDKIRKEKQQLVKEGKLKKKDLEEKPISEDEIPFEIPKGWVWVRLKDISACITDGDHLPPPQSASGIPFLVISNVISGTLDFTKTRFVPQEYFDKLSDERKAKINDVLFTVTGSYGKAILVSTDRTFCFQRHIALVRPLCYSPYILNSLNSPYIKGVCDDKATGMAQKTVGLETLRSLLIPLPPLAEQQRIVAKIEELLPKVEEYGKAQEKLNKLNEELPERLKKSILQEAIEGRLVKQDPNDEPASALLAKIREEKKQLVKKGKLKKKDLEVKTISEDEIPFEIPESWEWCRLGEYASKVTDFVASGSFASLRENVKYYANEEYAILVRTKDFQTNFQTDLVYTDKHGYEFLSNSNLFGGELILPNIGASIGKVFIVPPLDYRMTLAPNSVMVRFCWDEQRDWIYLLFSSNFGKSLLYDISSSTAQGKFNKTDFKQLLIPIPPLAEQHRIVEKIEQLFKAIDKMKK